MYGPLSKAFNIALEELSRINLAGLPKFEGHIVCVPWGTGITSSRELSGSEFKPDITVNSFSDALRFCNIKNHSLRLSQFVDAIPRKGPGSANPTLCMPWEDVLTTIEVKRGQKSSWPKLKNFTSEGVVPNLSNRGKPLTTHAGPSSGTRSRSKPLPAHAGPSSGTRGRSTTRKTYLLYSWVCS